MKKRLLVAEDDQQLNALYKQKLGSAGFDVKTVTDGAMVFSAIRDWTPDLILLDLLMPKKDGYEVLKELKKNHATKHIPVVIASNLGEMDNRQMCLQMGAVDYFVKTEITLSGLADKLKKFL